MTSRIGFGVVGCGEISMQTIPGISAAEHAEVAMLMDVRPELLDEFAQTLAAPTTTDYAELLANPEVDAVYIATPHYLHVPLGIQAAEAGKHVLVEKPIATTLEDADSLIAACEKAGVKLSVAFSAQVSTAMAEARRLIRAGIIGDVVGTRLASVQRKPDTYWHGGFTQRVRDDWRIYKDQAGGGVLIMNLIHDLNTVRWVTGLEAERVYAEYATFATSVEVEDYIVATVRYDNGAVGLVQGGSHVMGGLHDDIAGPRIYGTKGQIILSSKQPMICLEQPAEGGLAGSWQPMPFAAEGNARTAMIEGFASAISDNTRPPVTGMDGRAALAIALAAYRSGELGQPVELAEFA